MSAPALPESEPSPPPAAPAAYLWQSIRLALGIAAALGLARFAYGLLVPAMNAELGWTLAQAGAVTTANGLGSLVGAGATAAVARRISITRTFQAGMVVTAATLAVTAATSSFPALLAARTISGVASSAVFVTGGVLAARLSGRAGTPTPVTVYYAGAGLGVAFSGAVLPALLERHAERWPLAWAVLAAAAALAAAASWTAARSDRDPDTPPSGRRQLAPLWRIAVAYVLFGAGYIAFITFLSAYLVDQDAPVLRVTLAWVLLGMGAVVTPGLWNRLIAAVPGTRALAMLLGGMAVSAVLPLLSPAPAVVLAAGVLYGATLMSPPSALTALVRTTLPPADWAPTLGVFASLFSAGQTISPWIVGALADQTTSATALIWTAVLCGLAAILTATHRTSPTRLPSAG